MEQSQLRSECDWRKRLVVVRVVRGSWQAGGRRWTEQGTRAQRQDREARLEGGSDGLGIATNVRVANVPAGATKTKEPSRS